LLHGSEHRQQYTAQHFKTSSSRHLIIEHTSQRPCVCVCVSVEQIPAALRSLGYPKLPSLGDPLDAKVPACAPRSQPSRCWPRHARVAAWPPLITHASCRVASCDAANKKLFLTERCGQSELGLVADASPSTWTCVCATSAPIRRLISFHAWLTPLPPTRADAGSLWVTTQRHITRSNVSCFSRCREAWHEER
jgi:hypothetical protein